MRYKSFTAKIHGRQLYEWRSLLIEVQRHEKVHLKKKAPDAIADIGRFLYGAG